MPGPKPRKMKKQAIADAVIGIATGLETRRTLAKKGVAQPIYPYLQAVAAASKEEIQEAIKERIRNLQPKLLDTINKAIDEETLYPKDAGIIFGIVTDKLEQLEGNSQLKSLSQTNIIINGPAKREDILHLFKHGRLPEQAQPAAPVTNI